MYVLEEGEVVEPDANGQIHLEPREGTSEALKLHLQKDTSANNGGLDLPRKPNNKQLQKDDAEDSSESSRATELFKSAGLFNLIINLMILLPKRLLLNSSF